ncbi:MAG: PIN domain-containing protein [Chloroflexi bacterium]|nr:PIN domain-containing protein [Chloroflexota bacterium]
MYLVDTNVWLERLLDQERSEEVGNFLAQTPAAELAMSDFTLHSIGIVLTRLGQPDALLRFVDDVFVDGGVTLVSVRPDSLHHVVDAMRRFSLDFDDAYQYAAAEQAGATVISLDADFDRTDSKRRTPGEAVGGSGNS